MVGGAGFIGSHLVEVLATQGEVTVFDNFSVGKEAFLEMALTTGRVRVVRGDLLDRPRLAEAIAGHDVVFHLAANPEARYGLENTAFDLEQGTIATYNVLEAMRTHGVPRIVFSSSGTVYGETASPCGEMDLGHLPISLYGASKLACEAMISAFAECFGLTARILRFGNVVGPRGTHGAALDFLKKLRDRDGAELEVLGDGRQQKPYLHVSDCVRGLVFVRDAATSRCEVVNLAPRETTSVARIAELCVACSPFPSAPIRYTGGARGWPGDVPRSQMIPDKLEALGFRLTMRSDEAVERAVRELAAEVFPR